MTEVIFNRCISLKISKRIFDFGFTIYGVHSPHIKKKNIFAAYLMCDF